ncbi:MAG: branched-chain amino acid ABC transporter permease [Planctomycetes bacterium]|nr:branched-chain amino acid ABC transporter permease [Planctomycetota bacterium]
MDFDKLLNFWGHHLVMAGVWIALALSLNLINGFTGLFSLGHQGFWGVGAYVTAVVLTVLPAEMGWADAGMLSFLMTFPLAMLVAALFGLIVGVPCLRMRGDYLAIATLGFGEIFRNIAINSEWLGTSQGLSVPNVFRAFLQEQIGLERMAARRAEMFFYIALSWAVALLTLLLLRNLMRSAHGRAITAIRDDETAAELLGVNLTRYKVLVFVLGAALAGLAGAVYANYQRYVSPNQFGFMQGVIFLVIVVMGGMGSFSGTILAALLIYAVPVFLTFAPDTWVIPIFYDPTQGGVVHRSLKDLWQVFFSLMLIIVVLLRPQGLMGNREFSLVKLWRRLFGKKSESASTSGEAGA